MRLQITKQPKEPAIIEMPIAAKSALKIKSSIVFLSQLFLTVLTQPI
jgi:hypothetical protein